MVQQLEYWTRVCERVRSQKGDHQKRTSVGGRGENLHVEAGLVTGFVQTAVPALQPIFVTMTCMWGGGLAKVRSINVEIHVMCVANCFECCQPCCC